MRKIFLALLLFCYVVSVQAATEGANAYQYSGSSGQTAVGPAISGADYGAIATADSIAVGVKWHTNDATVTVSDEVGNTYIPLTKRKHTTVNEWVQIFYVISAIADATPVIGASFSAAVDRPSMVWVAISGLDASNPLEEEAWGESSANTTVSTSAINASGAGYIFAMGVHSGSGIFNGAGGGFTILYNPDNGFAGIGRVITTSDSYTPSLTHASNRNSVLAAVLFVDVAEGGGGGTSIPVILQHLRRMKQ